MIFVRCIGLSGGSSGVVGLELLGVIDVTMIAIGIRVEDCAMCRHDRHDEDVDV